MTIENLKIPGDAFLSSNNFSDWKLIVQSMLQQHKLDGLVNS